MDGKLARYAFENSMNNRVKATRIGRVKSSSRESFSWILAGLSIPL